MREERGTVLFCDAAKCGVIVPSSQDGDESDNVFIDSTAELTRNGVRSLNSGDRSADRRRAGTGTVAGAPA